MGIMANQHNAPNRARLAGIIAADGAGWLALPAQHDATVEISITMTSKRAAGGLFMGGIPFS